MIAFKPAREDLILLPKVLAKSIDKLSDEEINLMRWFLSQPSREERKIHEEEDRAEEALLILRRERKSVGLPSPLSLNAQKILDLVQESVGIKATECCKLLGFTKKEWGDARNQLRDRKLLRLEGKTTGARLFPATIVPIA